MSTSVLVTDEPNATFEEELSVFGPFGIELHTTVCRSEEELIRHGRGKAGFLVSYARITRRVMEALPELQVIVKYGIGVDNIDLQAAAELGKVVANVPDYCREEVAIHALSLALNGLRRTHALGAEVIAGTWNDTPAGKVIYRPSQLDLGIVGVGNIGRVFASYAERLFRAVYFYDPYVLLPQEEGRRYRRLKALAGLFERCRVISLHVPLTEATQGLINRSILSRARQLVLINTSRSGVVDKRSLEEALDSGKAAFYGADVYWEEPPDWSEPWNAQFLKRKDVLITPHAAWYSPASRSEVKRRAAEEVLRVIRGEKALHPIAKKLDSSNRPDV